MSLKIGKILIRAIIFLLTVQFILPAFIQANLQDDNSNRVASYSKPTDQSLLISFYLKENNSEEKEGEGEDHYNFISSEILDFSYIRLAINDNHNKVQPLVSSLLISDALPAYKVNCTFLI